jgi:hypothetical protein
VWHGGKAIDPPLLGFPLPPPAVCTGLGEGGKDHLTAGTPSTRQGDAAPRRKGEKREPAGDQEQEPRRTTTGVNLYLAFVHLSTEPATTPPPPRSEQHRGHLISFLPP